jgi:hypothetical protein
LHNASLCYLAWGVSFVARVFDRAVGAALWLLVLHLSMGTTKNKRQCAASALAQKP